VSASPRAAATSLLVGACLAACAVVPEGHAPEEPAHVEEIEGTDLHRLTLTSRAADRLALETAPARRASEVGLDGDALTVPYSALLYTSDGAAWVYRSSEPLVFVREAVTVADIVGDVVLLGPGEPGMTVVTVGAIELFGAESGLGAGAH
jgi:hypothetical protein